MIKFPTTTVGSFPKPDYLQKARARFAKEEITRAELTLLEQQATREIIAWQEALGLDILVDGEMYRGDMTTYFAENLEGYAVSGLVRSYGNRYYRKPVVTGEVHRRRPITIEWWKYAQGLTERPIKGMLTGPYTLMDWSFDENYGSREACTMALAQAVHEEVADLAAAGCRYIQVDEPAISVRPEELDLAIRAMEVVTSGVEAYFITHICYGDFNKIYPKLLDIPVHQIDLELSNSGFDMLERFHAHPFTKDIGLGVLDVHTHATESPEHVESMIRKALTVMRPDQIWVDPDCGLKTRTLPESEAKLKVMMDVVEKLRAED